MRSGFLKRPFSHFFASKAQNIFQFVLRAGVIQWRRIKQEFLHIWRVRGTIARVMSAIDVLKNDFWLFLFCFCSCMLLGLAQMILLPHFASIGAYFFSFVRVLRLVSGLGDGRQLEGVYFFSAARISSLLSQLFFYHLYFFPSLLISTIAPTSFLMACWSDGIFQQSILLLLGFPWRIHIYATAYVEIDGGAIASGNRGASSNAIVHDRTSLLL